MRYAEPGRHRPTAEGVVGADGAHAQAARACSVGGGSAVGAEVGLAAGAVEAGTDGPAGPPRRGGCCAGATRGGVLCPHVGQRGAGGPAARLRKRGLS